METLTHEISALAIESLQFMSDEDLSALQHAALVEQQERALKADADAQPLLWNN